jgi:hypothetical protein
LAFHELGSERPTNRISRRSREPRAFAPSAIATDDLLLVSRFARHAVSTGDGDLMSCHFGETSDGSSGDSLDGSLDGAMAAWDV